MLLPTRPRRRVTRRKRQHPSRPAPGCRPCIERTRRGSRNADNASPGCAGLGAPPAVASGSLTRRCALWRGAPAARYRQEITPGDVPPVASSARLRTASAVRWSARRYSPFRAPPGSCHQSRDGCEFADRWPVHPLGPAGRAFPGSPYGASTRALTQRRGPLPTVDPKAPSEALRWFRLQRFPLRSPLGAGGTTGRSAGRRV